MKYTIKCSICKGQMQEEKHKDYTKYKCKECEHEYFLTNQPVIEYTNGDL
jgi:DNA-directed RNA polymerase subunit RPC12/RpoP